MRVERERSAVRMLSCFGSRCWIRTRAIPVAAGSFCSSLGNASSPPADAPIPTIGKEGAAAAETKGLGLRGVFRAAVAGSRFFAMCLSISYLDLHYPFLAVTLVIF